MTFLLMQHLNSKEPINPSNHDKEFCNGKISNDTTFEIPSADKENVLKYLSNVDI